MASVLTLIAPPALAQMLMHPNWSPDGKQLVFYRFNEGTADLFMLDRSSGSARRLTDDDLFDSNPAFSPDGRQIVYGRDQGGNWDAWIRPVDSDTPHRITNTPEREMHFDWSPDGEWISFVRWVAEDDTDVIIQHVETGTEHRLTDSERRDFHPKWSSDGGSIVFDGTSSGQGSRIYRVSIPVKVADRPVVRMLFDLQNPEARARTPDLSPNGNHVAYALFPGEGEPQVVVVRNLETGHEEVVSRPTGGSGPTFSPDGRFLAYHSPPEPDSGARDLVVQDLETGDRFVLGAKDLPRSVAEISMAYLQAEMDLDWTAMRSLYADSVRIHDPTGRVFGTPLGGHVVTGRDSVLTMQQGWGIREADFEIDESFSVGEHAVHRGTYRVLFEGADAPNVIGFVTMHRIVQDRVVSRLDFGDYVESFGMSDSLRTVGERTMSVAREYLDAYFAEDVDAQRRLLHPDALFQDPTAQVLGPAYGRLISGSGKILGRRAGTYENVSEFDLDVERSFVSHEHAVFSGSVRYTTRSGARFVQPAVMIVEVRGGLVTRHWDFVDYSVGPVR